MICPGVTYVVRPGPVSTSYWGNERLSIAESSGTDLETEKKTTCESRWASEHGPYYAMEPKRLDWTVLRQS